MKKKFKHIFFCDYSQTYRSYPENYWLATLRNNEVIFDSWDGAIKNHSFKTEIIKLHEEIKEYRNVHKRLYKCDNLTPVIVKSDYHGLGVQFWTDWQIRNRVCENTDKTKSYFLTKL